MITRITTDARVGHSHVVLDVNIDDSLIHLTINGVTQTFPAMPSDELLETSPDKVVEAAHTIRTILEACKAAEL